MKIILEKPTLINGAMYAAGDTVEITAMCEIEQGYAALDAITLKTFVLDAPCLIGSDIYQAGDEISSTAETINKGYKDYENQVKRLLITQSAGDTQSLLGTTSDAVQVMVTMQCIHITALNKAKTFEEYKKAYQSELDRLSETSDSLPVFSDKCSNFLQSVADKQITLTYMVKYTSEKISSVLTDVAKRATAISSILGV